ncbi:MAG: alpha-ketoacid dehydrogenase subunit beta [Chloroflexi bacterium]|nr:alpha-ketoacid dehydrogenase subunit beta [Chloroflexota bacterium]MCL5075385.1 alpha-ketoacid dehydrogenase subunit beta [Chloroflexota bacterium]
MRTISFLQAINEALRQEMERDETVFLLGEDIAKMGGDFGATRGLWQRFGSERVKDTPLSEAAILGVANGAAFVGMRPVAEIMFADFITECYDQIVNNATKAHHMFGGQIKCPIVIRTACGGGFHAGPHHSQSIEGWFMNVPGLTIVAPSTPYDAKGLLIASIRDDNPILFLEHKMLYGKKGKVPEEPYIVPIGVANIKRAGNDVTVIASMKTVHDSLDVASELEKEGISVEVLDLRTILPLDKPTILKSVAKTGRAVIVHEASKTGGPGAEICALLAEEGFGHLKKPPKRVAALDAPLAFAPGLEDYILPSKEDIRKAILEVMRS